MFDKNNLSKEQSKELLEEAGIIDKDGNLKEPYDSVIDTVEPSTVLEYIDDTLNMLGENFDSRNISFIEKNIKTMKKLFIKRYLNSEK